MMILYDYHRFNLFLIGKTFTHRFKRSAMCKWEVWVYHLEGLVTLQELKNDMGIVEVRDKEGWNNKKRQARLKNAHLFIKEEFLTEAGMIYNLVVRKPPIT